MAIFNQGNIEVPRQWSSGYVDALTGQIVTGRVTNYKYSEPIDISQVMDISQTTPDGSVIMALPYSPCNYEGYTGLSGIMFFNQASIALGGVPFPVGNMVKDGFIFIKVPRGATYFQTTWFTDAEYIYAQPYWFAVDSDDDTAPSIPRVIEATRESSITTIESKELFTLTQVSNKPLWIDFQNNQINIQENQIYSERTATLLFQYQVESNRISVPVVIKQPAAQNHFPNPVDWTSLITKWYDGQVVNSEGKFDSDVLFKRSEWTKIPATNKHLIFPFYDYSPWSGKWGIAFYDISARFISGENFGDTPEFRQYTRPIAIPENADTFIVSAVDSDSYGTFYLTSIDSQYIDFPPTLFEPEHLSSLGGTVTYNVSGLSGYNVSVSSLQWIRGSYGQGRFEFTFEKNPYTTTREGTIYVTLSAGGQSHTYNILFVQNASNPAIPIWRDYWVELDDVYKEKISYRILFRDRTYEGQVYTLNNKVRFKINDIISDYLSNHLLLEKNTAYDNDEGIIDVEIYTSLDGFLTEEWYAAERFCYDWTYDEGIFIEPYLSNPIQNYMDPRQWFILTTFTPKNTPSSLNQVDGDDQLTLYLNVSTGQPKNYTYKMNDGLTGKKLTFDGIFNFTVRETCHDFCLYYLNEKGGYDFLLIDGTTKKTTNFNRDTYSRNYDNNSTFNSGRVNYQTTKTETYELNTGYLTDIQSEKIQQLFSSNQIYLHDLTTDRIIPVLMDVQSVDLKTFRNQGRNLYNYTITVTTANEKIRK